MIAGTWRQKIRRPHAHNEKTSLFWNSLWLYAVALSRKRSCGRKSLLTPIKGPLQSYARVCLYIRIPPPTLKSQCHCHMRLMPQKYITHTIVASILNYSLVCKLYIYTTNVSEFNEISVLKNTLNSRMQWLWNCIYE